MITDRQHEAYSVDPLLAGLYTLWEALETNCVVPAASSAPDA